MSRWLRTILGCAILLLAATTPIQIIYAYSSDTDPPKALAWIAAGTPVLTMLAAALAAYWTSQQAHEAGRQANEMIRARAAEHLTPVLTQAIDVLHDSERFAYLTDVFMQHMDKPDHLPFIIDGSKYSRRQLVTEIWPPLSDRLYRLIHVFDLFSEAEIVRLISLVRVDLMPGLNKATDEIDLPTGFWDEKATTANIEAALDAVVARGKQLIS